MKLTHKKLHLDKLSPICSLLGHIKKKISHVFFLFFYKVLNYIFSEVITIDKQYKCFSLKLAGYLMQKGFVLFEVNKDQKSKRFVYLFKNSDSLISAVNEYKINKKNT